MKNLQTRQSEWDAEKLRAEAEHSQWQLWVCESTEPVVLVSYIHFGVLALRPRAQEEFLSMFDQFKARFGAELKNWCFDAEGVHKKGESTPFADWWQKRWTDSHAQDAEAIIGPYVDKWLLGSELAYKCVCADIFLDAAEMRTVLRNHRAKAPNLMACTTGIEPECWRGALLSTDRIEKTIRAVARKELRGHSYHNRKEKTLALYALIWAEYKVPEVPGESTPITLYEAASRHGITHKPTTKLSELMAPYDKAMGTRKGPGAPFMTPHKFYRADSRVT